MDACQTHIEADVVLTKNGKIWRDSVLPKTPAEMELFLSKRFGRKSRDKVDLGRIELNGMDFNEWAVEPTADKADLRNLCNKAEDAFNHSR